MAEQSKQEKKTEAKATKPELKLRLVLQSRVEQFKMNGWKATGKTSKSGELIEMTK